MAPDGSVTVGHVLPTASVGMQESPLADEAVKVRNINSLVETPCLTLEDKDFDAWFNGQHWSMRWKWKNGPRYVKNQMSDYGFRNLDRDKLHSELDKWVENQWLIEYDPEKHGECQGLIPILGKDEPAKDRVRPVLDFQEFNELVINCPGADSAVCDESLRSWRQMGNNVAFLDLTKAYLQVHVDPDLWKYLAVKYKGKIYVMSRMAFGLCVAPKVMGRIVKSVLALQPEIGEATDSYIDDIMCVSSKIDILGVKEHLSKYGLESKDPVKLSGARVLGLRVKSLEDGTLVWSRDKPLEAPAEKLTREALYSFCGKLVGHYPVAGWLRPCCSFLKRMASTGPWNSPISDAAQGAAEAVWRRVSEGEDLVRGRWDAPPDGKPVVWCDASSIAIGCCLAIDGHIVEDCAWLRPADDKGHINVADLESVVRGLNLALKWHLKNLTIVTDSATVYSWLKVTISRDRRIRNSGLSEMITKRRIGIIKELVDLYEVNITPLLVKSETNLADPLTRVPRDWISAVAHTGFVGVQVGDPTRDRIQTLHDQHHLGIKRTLHLARRHIGPNIRKSDVKPVVIACSKCASVDPAPIRYPHGKIAAENCWEKWAIDITHYGNAILLICG